MAQRKTSLQHLRQALDALRQELETVESALIEFEEEVLGGEKEPEKEPGQGRSGAAQQLFNCSQ
jgi:hypothetical protein